MTSETDTSRMMALAFIDRAFTARYEEAIGMFSDDLVWQVMGPAGGLRVSGRHDGPRAERMLRAMPRALPHGFRHHIMGVTAEKSRVAIEVEAEAETIDGRLYRNQYHFLIRVADGRIAEVREYMDTLSVYRLEHGEG